MLLSSPAPCDCRHLVTLLPVVVRWVGIDAGSVSLLELELIVVLDTELELLIVELVLELVLLVLAVDLLTVSVLLACLIRWRLKEWILLEKFLIVPSALQKRVLVSAVTRWPA